MAVERYGLPLDLTDAREDGMSLDETEGRRRATSVKAAPFPPQPEDVSHGWLTSVLRDRQVIPSDVSVTGLRFDCLSDGVGMMGTRSAGCTSATRRREPVRRR